jgi:hypothetical protein
MNIHFHPSNWFHHGRIAQARPRQTFHNEIVWAIIIMVVALVALAAIMMVFGPPQTITSPYLPSFPF